MSSQSDTICTPDELANAASSGLYCFTRRENVAIVVIPFIGFISLTAVLVVMALIVRNVIRSTLPGTESPLPAESPLPRTESSLRRPKASLPRPKLVKRAMDVYMLSLFAADFVQALGVVLEIRWIDAGKVRIGSFCTAQGVLQHLGETAVAMTTIIITVHTFAALWWANNERVKWACNSVKFACVLAVVPWFSLFLFIVISASAHKSPPFYAPTPYWCWVSHNYPNYRLAGENFWIWLAFAVSLLYIPLLFWAKGYITPSGWTFKVNSQKDREGRSKLGLIMIICALAYCIPVLPTSLARWFAVVQNDDKPFSSSEAQFSSKAIFSLSGAIDVVVFLLARQGLLLFGEPPAEEPILPDTTPKNPAPIELQYVLPGHVSGSSDMA